MKQYKVFFDYNGDLFCLLILILLISVFLGALFALIDMSLTIYKAQLSLSKMEIYIMDFTDYFASLIVAVFIAHFGSKGNRTKWVAASCILMGVGSMIFAFPFSKYEIIRSGRQKIGEILFWIYYHVLHQYWFNSLVHGNENRWDISVPFLLYVFVQPCR